MTESIYRNNDGNFVCHLMFSPFLSFISEYFLRLPIRVNVNRSLVTNTSFQIVPPFTLRYWSRCYLEMLVKMWLYLEMFQDMWTVQSSDTKTKVWCATMGRDYLSSAEKRL